MKLLKNAVIFGADNSSSSHAYNGKINFLIQVKAQLSELIEVLVHLRKKL